ncbi:carbamoyltransferase C-terminal domain-containing protein [Burkholderia vietnamiensis]|uniref:carbamoyltransferase C-terminal domain-containing protein n=1 Tax=Burkholderia vietnamiensis TaxID=60552 RepID=UPI001594491E|nr:carbamoyltransferase C-terminal domain-containing protein [Burkholderia vietnamiensis]
MSHRIPPAHADGVLGVQTGPAPNTGAAWVATAAGARRIAHAGQERFDRIKQSCAYPAAAVDACRIALDLPADARPSLVACVDTGQAAPLPPYVDTVPQLRVEHALCHAAAGYYCSPFDEAAILVVDGHRREQGATPSSHSVWIGWNGRIEPVMRSASCGIGALYEAVTVAIGFGAHETGKTMGLAPYGDDAAAPDLGGRLDGLAVDYGARCDADGARLFGLSPLAGATDDASLTARATLARAAQRECERAMLHLARAVREMTGIRRLCLAGEVSLNGRANDLVWRDAGFDAVFAGPAGADCGTALGAALWGYHGVQGVPFRPGPFSPYGGRPYSEADVDAALAALPDRARYRDTRGTIDELAERTAALLAAGQCVALHAGRAEMGPRALGNRSLLMSPAHADARDRMNLRVKRREAFRPFAPCVPVEDAARYFELDTPSPYMLRICAVRPQWRARLAAITHVDGTARPQTVSPQDNPHLHRLLRAFERVAGIPVLLNTSFNVAGEPLVETPADALRGFARNDIDALWIGDRLLEKR